MKQTNILLIIIFSALSFSQEPYMFPDDVLPPQVESFPERPPMIFEIGDKFFSNGDIHYGINPWSGTYWQPGLWGFGNYRIAHQYLTSESADSPSLNNVVNRFDFFLNLKLSGTERFFAAFRPLDKGGMTGVDLTLDESEFVHNFEEKGEGELFKQWFFPATWFFEGDIAELFQFLDYEDRLPRDVGFTIGRQPVFFQEGIVLNDILETFGVSFNGLHLPYASNFKVSLMAGKNHIDRDGTDETIYGMFSEADFYKNMVNVDIAYVQENMGNKTDGLVIGGSNVQQFGFWNTALRFGYSKALGDSSDIGDGMFFMGEFSRKHYPYKNIIYVNTYYKHEAFTPAGGKGAFGRTGILFAPSGMTGHTPPMGAPLAPSEFGISSGYQLFMDGGRQSIISEISFRQAINEDLNKIGLGFKFMKAFGQRYVLNIDGYFIQPNEGDYNYGARTEFLVKL